MVETQIMASSLEILKPYVDEVLLQLVMTYCNNKQNNNQPERHHP
jgi:hypothetical protein